MQINFQAFTENAQRVAKQVVIIALRYNQTHLDLEHVLLALFEVPDDQLEYLFDVLNIDKEYWKNRIEFVVSKFPRSDDRQLKAQQFTINKRMKLMIEQAQYEANRLWMKDIKPIHLFLAAIEIFLNSEKKSACGKIVSEMGITQDGIRRIVIKLR